MYRIGICDDEKGTCANLENIIYKFGDEHGFQFDIDVWYSGEKLCEYLKQKTVWIWFLIIKLKRTFIKYVVIRLFIFIVITKKLR